MCMHNMVFSATLDLSVDAVSIDIPGGYIVPEKGNVTFTCSSSSALVSPDWRVDLKTLGNTAGLFTSSADLRSLPRVSSTDNSTFPNPTSFTVHNIPAESNGSYVECSSRNLGISSALILVEGESL